MAGFARATGPVAQLRSQLRQQVLAFFLEDREQLGVDRVDGVDVLGALDRHLATRLADYDYDRDFGGIYYLFLRGMAEAHPPGCGVFFDRPDAATVRRVSALIGHGEEGPA